MNIEKSTMIARPYALAAFEFASTKHALASWEYLLQTGAAVANDPRMKSLLDSPVLTKTQLAEFFCDLLGGLLDTEKKNFIYLLAENKRLAFLPAIAELFKTYHAAQQKKLTIQLTSATTLDAQYQDQFAEALKRRLKQDVDISYEVDASLLGGATVRIGDTVIDGSVKRQLDRLRESFLR